MPVYNLMIDHSRKCFKVNFVVLFEVADVFLPFLFVKSQLVFMKSSNFFIKSSDFPGCVLRVSTTCLVLCPRIDVLMDTFPSPYASFPPHM